MTICNRLRTEEMHAPVPASPSSAGSSDAAYESADIHRMNVAVTELRSCCQTNQALQSFEIFETQLKKSLGIPSPTKSSAIDGTADMASEDEMRMLRVQRRRQQIRPCQQRSTPKHEPAMLTPTKLEHPLPNIWSRLALPKSKTTSNLLTLQSPSRLPTPQPSHPKPGEWLSPHATSRATGPQEAPERRNEVLKDIRQFVKTPVKVVQQRMSAPRNPSYSSNVNNTSGGKTLTSSKTMPHLRKASTTTADTRTPLVSRMGGFDKVSENLTCAAFETGRPPPPLPRDKTPGSAVKLVDGEKILKSRRRSERKSSGEIIKGVLDAGMKQVKQMGKKVGGSMSWVGSQEDLSINVLATGSR